MGHRAEKVNSDWSNTPFDTPRLDQGLRPHIYPTPTTAPEILHVIQIVLFKSYKNRYLLRFQEISESANNRR